MKQAQTTKRILTGILYCSSLALAADTTHIKGLIQGRSGSTMLIRGADTETVSVLLTDKTKVGQSQGLFSLGRKDMAMTALIPGLPVQIEATKGDQNQLVATSVKFKGDDLKRAEAIQAGLHETQTGLSETRALSQKNSTEIANSQQEIAKSKQDIAKSQVELDQQKATLQVQKTALDEQQVQVTDHQKKITEHQAAITAAVARFGQLDDYFILDEQTVYFANGQVMVDQKYQAPLLELAQKAKTVDGFMIEIKGYASTLGDEAVNEKISADRADNVARLLTRKGQIPLTNMLAPAAMGESEQVEADRRTQTSAQNRRVVVRILQNKAIAGLQASATGLNGESAAPTNSR